MGNQSVESGQTSSTSLLNVAGSLEEGPSLHPACSIEEGQSLHLGSMEEEPSLHLACSTEEGLSSLHLGSMERSSLHLADSIEEGASSTVAVELEEQMERLNINNNNKRPSAQPRNRNAGHRHHFHPHLRNVNPSITNATFSMPESLVEEHLRRARANAFSMQQQRHLLEQQLHLFEQQQRHLLEQLGKKHSMHPFSNTPQPRLRPDLPVMPAINAPATTTTSSNDVAANACVSQSEQQLEPEQQPLHLLEQQRRLFEQRRRHLFEQQQRHLLELQQHLLEQQRIKHSMHAFSITPQPRLRPDLPVMATMNAPATTTTSSNAVPANACSIEEGLSLHLGSMEEEPSLHLACSMEEGLSSLHLGSMEASLHLDSMEGSSLHLADSMVEGASSTVAVELAEQMERTNINNNKRPSAQPRNRNAGHQHHFHPHLRNVNPSITNATFSMRESLVEEHLRRTRANAFSMQQQRHLLEQQQLHLLEQQRIKHSMHAFSTTPQPRLRPDLPVMPAMNAPATTTTSSDDVAANACVSQSEPQLEPEQQPRHLLEQQRHLFGQPPRHLFEQQERHLLELQQHLLEQQRIKHSMHAFSTTPQPRLRPGLPLMLAMNAPATATTSSNAVAANAPSI